MVELVRYVELTNVTNHWERYWVVGIQVIRKTLIVFFEIIIGLICLVGLYVFGHSTPERSIRTYLFFDGHLIDAFRTEVFLGRDDWQYGKQYCTKNPGLGPDFISVDKGEWGLWFVNLNTSGGG